MFIAQIEQVKSTDYIWFSADQLQSNARYTFKLGHNEFSGSVWFRRNLSPSVWQRLAIPCTEPFTRLRIDENLLVLITQSGQLWRVKHVLSADPQQFKYYRSFGFPLGHGPGIRLDTEKIQELAVSNANAMTTKYYEDRRGNKHARHISQLYVLYKGDHFIHHADPWVSTDWEYKFPLPIEQANYVYPANKGLPGYQAGLSAAAGVVGIVSSLGVYTIEYDFDINGANPLINYRPYNLGQYSGVGKLFFNTQTPLALPAPGWKKHTLIPGAYTGNLVLNPMYDEFGNILPGSRSRIMRVLGVHFVHGELSAGYWEKQLTDTRWNFVVDQSFDPGQILKYVINEDGPELIPKQEQIYVQQQTGLELSLQGFQPYVNLWEENAAQLKLSFVGGAEYALKLFTQIQFHLQKKKERSSVDYFSGFLVLPEGLPEDNSVSAKKLRKYLRVSGKERFLWVFIRVRSGEILIRKNRSILRKIAFFNWLNILIGKSLFKVKNR